MEGFFGNLQETGWNDWFNGQLQSSLDSILASDVNTFTAFAVQALANQGFVLTPDQIQSQFGSLGNSLSDALNQLIGSGIAEVEGEILSDLQIAVSNAQRKAQSDSRAPIRVQPDRPKWISCAYFGVALDGVSFAAWALGAEPVVPVFAFAGFLLGALAFKELC